jgi:hypothetical protein
MFVATLLSILTCSFAFQAPTQFKTSTVALSAERSKAVPFLEAPKNLKGLVGDKGFDPIGFSDWIDVNFLAEAEIKHGRIAMLATLGWVITEFVKLPGDVHNVTPLEAHNVAVASGSAFQVLTVIAGLEFIGVVALKELFEGKRKAGEFGFDPLNLWGKTEAERSKRSLQEIENGRLAMLAFAGIATQAALNGKGFPYF